MLIRDSDWKRIRAAFTEVEKQQLRAALTGETICPRGVTVDEEKVPALAAKIRKALEERR